MSAGVGETRPAIFLDRDGVIIENRDNYVRCWDDVAIYPHALEALRRIRDLPRRIVIVTNQSAVGRGLITLAEAKSINDRLLAVIEEAGGRIDGVFMCPHAPEAGCSCRKPAPGLLFEASRALHIDLRRSVLIGDALTDLQAGLAAGLESVVLVRTGRGAAQAQLPAAQDLLPFPVADALGEALEQFAS